MTKTHRMQQLTAVRKLKEDRDAIALARANAAKKLAQQAVDAANANHAAMQTSLRPRLTEHLRASSVLNGSTNRYTAYVMAANADRQAVAKLRDAAEGAQRACDVASRAAEAVRKVYAATLRQRESLEIITGSLIAADRKHALLSEEDRLSEQQSTQASTGLLR
jgi:hypothetical protein